MPRARPLALGRSGPYVSAPLDIELVILHANPARGGAERYTVDLAAALARRGHDVTLLCAGRRYAYDVVPCGDGHSYHLEQLKVRGLTRAGRYLRFLWARADRPRTRQDRPEITHAMLPVPGCDVYHPHAGVAASALGKWSIPFNPRRLLMALVERRLLGSPNGATVLCLSNYVKRFVRESYPSLPADRLERLFNAVDLDRFNPPPQRPASGWVNALIIAQDYERKGLAEAIRAVAQVPDSRLRLLVVGRQDPSAYAALARGLGVADRVVFHPPTASPQEFYRQADFFVLPTRHDPCSLVVLEALAMGLPVISTVYNGACEIMNDGTHGFVLRDPADAATLADAMRTLCDDDHRREMSQACLALRPALAYEHHLDELTRIYERVAAAPRRERAC